jgi:tetratricopeptide (TPR) repeat protein
MLYGKTLYALGQFQESITNLSPLHQRTQNREAAKVISLCYFALKDWASALVYLEKLMQQAVELSVLNLSAECYINLDQPEKALPLIQKSLELDPSQVKIREMEDRIKK